MKKATLFTLSALVLFACAAPVGSGDGDSGDGDGDGDGTPNTGGTTQTGTGGTIQTGTGGTVQTGTGGTVQTGTGGTTGGPVTCSAASWTVSEGYADNGQMCGYAWTAPYAAGGEITPPCGTAGPCFTGTTLCASGSIPAEAMESYPGIMIGWNVSQDSAGGAAGAWTATGSGVTVNFTATGATGQARVAIKSGGTDYCANATSGMMIPWGSFTVACWDAGGAAFSAGMPISELMVQLNSAATAQTISSFCLDSVTVN